MKTDIAMLIVGLLVASLAWTVGTLGVLTPWTLVWGLGYTFSLAGAYELGQRQWPGR